MSESVANETSATTLAALIEAQAGASLAIDDLLLLVLPLFEQVAALHAQGRVAALDGGAIVVSSLGGLTLRQPDGQPAAMDMDAVHRVQPPPGTTLNIVGELRLSHQGETGVRVADAALQTDLAAPITRPVYLPGFASWEIQLGHHDEISDIFRLGLVLAALSCGLDLSQAEDLERFAAHRRDLFVLEARLNPVVAATIVEMTALNRHERATDLASLATRLRTWRGQPLALDVARALAGVDQPLPRRAAVLSHLRDRLFDLSRRNRLLYFRATQSSVNLTVSSVPLILQWESIRPEQICTWGGPFAEELVEGRSVDLHRWLRFEDQPYLPVALDKLIQEIRRDRAEYGFSHLRLVVAFLRWHNLKESPEERINTPLLWLPLELTRRKGVRDQYLIQCESGEAEFNPVLRHQLRQLYDIRLPETVDLQQVSLAQIHADILAQIRASEPMVELRLVEKAQVKLVRQKALQRLHQYQRRRAASRSARRNDSALPDYSYDRSDYRPLGQALFERWVRPSPLPQRFEAGAPPLAGPRHARMMAESAEAEVEQVGYALQESEGHRYAWDLDLTQVTLANFNYKKMSLVRDYNQLLEQPTANPAFDGVFSIEPKAVDTELPAAVALSEQWNVVASDATQNAAISLARSRRSLIIQGPPGTGKSQTITNLIADYAGRGLRVLFVCEKRAALDVVFHRLKQSGLDELCCLIHDSQTDKKAFIADLRGCYERCIQQPDGREELAMQRQRILAVLAPHQQQLQQFEQAMTAVPEALGSSVRQLVRRLAGLPTPPEVGAAVRERLPALAAWDRQRELTRRLYRELQERFGVHSLAEHPFARLSAGLVADEHAYGRAEQALVACESLLETLDSAFDDESRLLTADLTLAEAQRLAAEAQTLLDQHLLQHLDLLDSGSAASQRLQQLRTELDERAEALVRAQSASSNWRDKLGADDTDSALALATRWEGSLLRWLQPAWWKLRREIKRRYDFSRHAVYPGLGKVLAALAQEHACAAAVTETESRARRLLDIPDVAGFLQGLSDWRQRCAAPGTARGLAEHLGQAPDALAAARAEAAASAPLQQLQAQVDTALSLADGTGLGEISELLRDLRESLDDLPDLLPLLRALHGADPAYAQALQRLPYPQSQLEALIAEEALRRVERGAPDLARFDASALARAARAVAEGQQRLLKLNASMIRATVHQGFTEHVRQASLSATQLDSSGREFKKSYSTGRRELEHEFGKSMRYRSIRDLSDDETGMVINDLKPIWLMSPLSVSDTLPLSVDLFDVVIFDEASQIPTEEAVPALSRARQIVVVGDEMQLPPTSFFSAGGSEEAELLVEEEGERIAINLDSDSLLNQAARNLPATLLAWHYRSRHEALISFSNAAFYDGRLVTIPDRLREATSDESTVLHSDQDDAASSGVDALMQRAVSFHRVADGVYLDRRNPAEARYIAQLVRELLLRESRHSLGIVAFSEAQQDEIESALEALAAEDSDFALRLEREYVREDEDQFNGLFVKNLENVQGDERDIIVLSICYAPGPDGRMLMNFGPINQRGGEKRLNVIFSRARHRMAVISTIQAEAITNVHNDGAAALRAFLQFAQASARGELEHAQQVLGALNPGARGVFTRQPPADSIRQALAQALRQRGHEVHEHVGRSQFRCDLAIAEADGEGYALAILLDAPDAVVADPRERYVFLPGILRSFGWRVIDIPGKDWLRDAEAVLLRIESALQQSDDDDGDDQDFDLALEAIGGDIAPDSGAAGSAEASIGSAEDATAETRQFRFEQGSSRKFWRISRDGCDMTVTYGRIGSSGQSQLKVFDSPERAEREVQKLIAEKLRKGYVEG